MKSILRAFGRASQAVPWNSEESIREELFSIERLEQHAESLAAAQGVGAGSITGRSLAVRLKENESVLLQTYRDIAGAVGEDGPLRRPPSGCSTTTISSKSRSARSATICRQATTASCRSWRAARRVSAGFGVAWAFIAHTDSRFDPEMRRFVRAYQRVQPLTIGELWAVAITLRVARWSRTCGARRCASG